MAGGKRIRLGDPGETGAENTRCVEDPPEDTRRGKTARALERPLESLSDDELLSGLADVLRQSRRVESSLIARIAEVDARRLRLSGIAKLAPALTPENRETLLRRAVHKSKREIEEMVAIRTTSA
jgi:uncharacterized protein YhaN